MAHNLASPCLGREPKTRVATIILTSLGELGLLSMVWIVDPTFLGCWALIVPTFVICFQQDDHVILLDVVTHVETDTSPFEMAL